VTVSPWLFLESTVGTAYLPADEGRAGRGFVSRRWPAIPAGEMADFQHLFALRTAEMVASFLILCGQSVGAPAQPALCRSSGSGSLLLADKIHSQVWLKTSISGWPT